MAHTSEQRWEQTAAAVSKLCTEAVESLLNAESAYRDLLELYNYVGNNAQNLADQLFYEDWSTRYTPGVQAEITIDVVAGELSNPVLVTAGTGYSNAIRNILRLTTTAGGGSGILTYDIVGGSISNVQIESVGADYLNGTGYTVLEVPAPLGIKDTQANADEVSRAQDLVSAMTSLHEIYQAADNVAIAQADRFTSLRRFT